MLKVKEGFSFRDDFVANRIINTNVTNLQKNLNFKFFSKLGAMIDEVPKN